MVTLLQATSHIAALVHIKYQNYNKFQMSIHRKTVTSFRIVGGLALAGLGTPNFLPETEGAEAIKVGRLIASNGDFLKKMFGCETRKQRAEKNQSKAQALLKKYANDKELRKAEAFKADLQREREQPKARNGDSDDGVQLPRVQACMPMADVDEILAEQVLAENYFKEAIKELQNMENGLQRAKGELSSKNAELETKVWEVNQKRWQLRDMTEALQQTKAALQETKAELKRMMNELIGEKVSRESAERNSENLRVLLKKEIIEKDKRGRELHQVNQRLSHALALICFFLFYRVHDKVSGFGGTYKLSILVAVAIILASCTLYEKLELEGKLPEF